ncbi:MAG TPA: DinB family protein [Anaerolineales bacterium]|nr:DinB family protein [Anaerolineales bacterium]
MDSYAPYDTLRAYKVNHKLILVLAESLSDEQMLWKPAGYNNSIGFNLWHIARWSDNLIAEVLKEYPELELDLGEPIEIWEQESLAEKWGLPPVLYPGGTGLSDEAADGLSFPAKDEMLAYLQKTFARTEEFIEKFDARYPGSDPIADPELHKKLSDIRWHLYYYLMHHCRHLGMMEAIKGLLTGKGSAAA